MSQIIGGHTFVPLEKNIDDVKLNAITGGATITSELISTQTLSTSAVTGDQFLLLKAGGTLARILYDDLATSIVGSSGMVGAITSVRLRTFSAVGNCNFEVDQRNVGNATTIGFSLDRWTTYKAGTMTFSAAQNSVAAGDVVVPATNFRITSKFLRVTLTTVEASLGASDLLQIYQIVEGPLWRELSLDVHSVSLLVRSSVAGLKFGFILQDSSTTTKSLAKLCTISLANTWTLIQLPNLPVWPAGNFTTAAGSASYNFIICLAAGTTVTVPANDTWQTGSFNGATGQSNFAASAVNSTFDIAFVQHEPGALCTTLIDKPFFQNLEECQRYYCKSYPYNVVPGANISGGGFTGVNFSGTANYYVSAFYPVRMANFTHVPLVYAQNGTANSVTYVPRGFGPGVTGVTVAQYSELGFSLVSQGSNTGADSFCQGQFTADTGW